MIKYENLRIRVKTCEKKYVSESHLYFLNFKLLVDEGGVLNMGLTGVHAMNDGCQQN